MADELKLAKKKAVTLAGALGSLSACSATLPAMAVRHGVHAVWVAVPLVALEAVAMVYVVKAVWELKRLEQGSAAQDLPGNG